jgi:hypothetical protein
MGLEVCCYRCVSFVAMVCWQDRIEARKEISDDTLLVNVAGFFRLSFFLFLEALTLTLIHSCPSAPVLCAGEHALQFLLGLFHAVIPARASLLH